MATATTNTMQQSVKKAAYAVRDGDIEGARENVETVARQAKGEVEKARKFAMRGLDNAVSTAKENPLASAGVLFGAGALVGALIYRLVRPTPTPGQVLLNAIKRGSMTAGETLLTGVNQARKYIG